MDLFKDFDLDLTKITKGGISPLEDACDDLLEGSSSGSSGMSGSSAISDTSGSGDDGSVTNFLTGIAEGLASLFKRCD